MPAAVRHRRYVAPLLAVRFKHAVALSVLGGFLEFIPVAGWLTTFAAVISVAMVSHSHWIWIAVLLFVVVESTSGLLLLLAHHGAQP